MCRASRTAAWNETACRIPSAKKTTAERLGRGPELRHEEVRDEGLDDEAARERIEREEPGEATDDRARATERSPFSACRAAAVDRARETRGDDERERRPKPGRRGASAARLRRRAPGRRRQALRASPPASQPCCTCRRGASRSCPPTAAGSIACSSDVNGPDSTTSVESVPVSAAMRSAVSEPVRAKTVPAIPMTTRRLTYVRRRPRASP